LGSYEGRLELTWTNKSRRLLAQEDGSYEWVDPADYRVAEVRLLDDLATVGEVGTNRAAANLIIRGDALNALRSLARLPEFAEQYLDVAVSLTEATHVSQPAPVVERTAIVRSSTTRYPKTGVCSPGPKEQPTSRPGGHHDQCCGGDGPGHAHDPCHQLV
jgi:hypothetical protein